MSKRLQQLTPTLILVVGTTIDRMYKENKELTLREIALILSPTIPTVLPILMGMLTDAWEAAWEAAKQTENLQALLQASSALLAPLWAMAVVWWVALFGPSPSDPTDAGAGAAGVKGGGHSETIEVEASLAFVRALVAYLTDPKHQASYQVQANKTVIQVGDADSYGGRGGGSSSGNRTTQTQEWTQVYIPYQNITILVDSLTLTFAKHNGAFQLCGAARSEAEAAAPVVDYPSVTSLTDLIPNPDLVAVMEQLRTSVSSKLMVNIGSMTLGTIEQKLYHDIATKCPKLKFQTFMIDLAIFRHLFHAEFGTTSMPAVHLYRMMLMSSVHKKQLNLFGHIFDATHDTTTLLTAPVERNSTVLERILDTLVLSEQQLRVFARDQVILRARTVWIQEFHKRDDSREDGAGDAANKDKNKDKNADSRRILSFHVASKDADAAKAQATFLDFVDVLQRSAPPAPVAAKVKIYDLKVTQEEKRYSDSNPEYQPYLEKKEMLSKMPQDAAATMLALADFARQTPPPEKLTRYSYESNVHATEVNEKYKSFDTLYLRERDVRALQNILHKFKNNRDLYEEYGLPNKLGILISGLPGTGKTTTIHAIASFLQKPIYYVHLNTVRTNEELQLIFDYVVLRSQEGGIIVFEDVDAMTTVVHDRARTGHAAATGGEGEGEKMTLEYLLNLLQGSLTRDGTIFIATTNHKEVLDPAFCREGRFDVQIDMKACDHYQVRRIYQKFVHRPICPEVLARIPEDVYTPAQLIFHLIQHIDSEEPCAEIMQRFLTKARSDERALPKSRSAESAGAADAGSVLAS